MHQTLDVLLLLAASYEVKYIFWVCHAVHKLLTKARSVECFKPTAVVNLGKATKLTNLNKLELNVPVPQVRPSYSQSNKRLLRGEGASKSFSFSFF